MINVRLLALAGSVMLVVSACWVHSKSGDYECGSDADCSGGRTCDTNIGFCVVQSCPGDCTSCNVAAKTCMIACTSSHKCGAVTCPDGYACTIQCGANNACDSVDCSGGKSCDVTCTTSGSCNDVTCGDGRCNVTCLQANACGDVQCGTACKCDVLCAGGSCGATTCPKNDTCTVDGTPATACTSARPGCSSC